MLTKQQALRRFRLSVSLFFFIQGLVFAAWTNRIADVKKALALSDAQLGNVLFSIPIGQVCAMGISAWLVNRYGSRRMLTLSSFFYPLFLIPLGFAERPYALSAGLFLFGMGANLFNLSSNTQGVSVESLHGKSIMASFHGLWSLGAFTSGAVSMAFIAMSVPPGWHFVFIFVCASLLAVFMRRLLLRSDLKPRKDPDGQQAQRLPFYKLYRRLDVTVVLLGVMAFCSMICEGCMYDWSGVYFMQVVEAPKEFVQLGYVVCKFTMTAGRFVTDYFTPRFGPAKVIRVCGLLFTCGMMLSVLFPTVLWATVGFFLVGFGISSTVPVCYSMAGNSKTMSSGMALAAVSSIAYMGFLIGPPAIGHVAHAISLHYTFAVIGGVGILISVRASLLMSKLRAK